MRRTAAPGKRLVIALLAIVFIAIPSMADTIVYSDIVRLGPIIYNRPTEPIPGIPTGALLSPIGTDVAFHDFGFTVDLAGTYGFLSIQDFDGFLVLYRNSFSPALPLTNYVTSNDDLLGITGFSGFSVTLLPSVNYFLVTTGFDNFEFGSFVNIISGPGTITAIPEPMTLLLLGTGLAGVAAATHKRRKLNKSDEA